MGFCIFCSQRKKSRAADLRSFWLYTRSEEASAQTLVRPRLALSTATNCNAGKLEVPPTGFATNSPVAFLNTESLVSANWWRLSHYNLIKYAESQTVGPIQHELLLENISLPVLAQTHVDISPLACCHQLLPLLSSLKEPKP